VHFDSGGIVYLCELTPDKRDHDTQVVFMNNTLAALPPSMRRPSAEKYVSSLNNMRQSEMLEYWDLWVACLVFRKLYPDAVRTPESQLMRKTWTYSLFTLPARFVDVGYLGHWRNFEAQIVDYDLID
jgi:hypothetical protein